MATRKSAATRSTATAKSTPAVQAAVAAPPQQRVLRQFRVVFNSVKTHFQQFGETYRVADQLRAKKKPAEALELLVAEGRMRLRAVDLRVRGRLPARGSNALRPLRGKAVATAHTASPPRRPRACKRER